MQLFLNCSRENTDLDTEVFRPVIKAAVMAVLTEEDINHDCEVSVMFTDNSGILELNSRFRNRRRPTDVLSFPVSEGIDVVNPENGALLLGDVVISLEWAAADAEEFGVSVEDMVAFLTIHSILHLLGYDHELSDEDAARMSLLQRTAMNKIGKTCPY